MLRVFLHLALLLGFTAALSVDAHAIGLKQNSRVSGDVITLSDVFYGLPRDEERVLGSAPRPGETLRLDAQTLMRVAVALDLPWRPRSFSDHIVLTRAATVINSDDIKDSIVQSLKDEGLTGEFNIALYNEGYQIVLPEDAPPTFEISALRHNPKHDWFEAKIVAPSQDNPIYRGTIDGKVQSLTKVPVLRESLRKGTIIGRQDVSYLSVPSRELNHDTILNEQELLGLTPRRIIMPGKPIKANEIEAPRLIKRGDRVTMVFQDGGLSLTAMGQALEHGAKGEFIRVSNSNSSRTIEALVTGEKLVTVNSY